MGVFEGSFSASIRVDARNLAAVARWMQQNGQQITRSGVIGQALAVVAKSVFESHPELQCETLEEAYTELLDMGLAPQSTRGLLNMARSLQAEYMSNSGDMQGLIKHLRHVAAGNGLKKEEIGEDVAEKMMDMATQKNTPGAATMLGISNEDMELVREMTAALRKQGATPAEIEEKRNWLVGKMKRQNLLKNDATLASQKQQMNDYTPILKSQAEQKQQIESLTFEQKLENFETSVVKDFGYHYESDLQDRHVMAATQRYKEKFFPDATDDDIERWLETMVEAARPLIDRREQENRELFAQQEREKKARKAARELAGK